MHKTATVAGQHLQTPEHCHQEERPPAWDKGKPLAWPGLGGSGSCEPWFFSWAPGEGWGLRGLGSARLTIPPFLGTAGFRLPLKLVLSATLTGTAIYQVCPAPAVPVASAPPSLDASGPAHLSKSVTHNPVQRLLMSWGHWPTQRKEVLTLIGLARSQSMRFGVV